MLARLDQVQEPVSLYWVVVRLAPKVVVLLPHVLPKLAQIQEVLSGVLEKVAPCQEQLAFSWRLQRWLHKVRRRCIKYCWLSNRDSRISLEGHRKIILSIATVSIRIICFIFPNISCPATTWYPLPTRTRIKWI